MIDCRVSWTAEGWSLEVKLYLMLCNPPNLLTSPPYWYITRRIDGCGEFEVNLFDTINGSVHFFFFLGGGNNLTSLHLSLLWMSNELLELAASFSGSVIRWMPASVPVTVLSECLNFSHQVLFTCFLEQHSGNSSKSRLIDGCTVCVFSKDLHEIWLWRRTIMPSQFLINSFVHFFYTLRTLPEYREGTWGSRTSCCLFVLFEEVL